MFSANLMALKNTLMRRKRCFFILVPHGNRDQEKKTSLISTLRRNASTRRVVYPDLVWQKSRDDLLGTDKSNVHYTNIIPFGRLNQRQESSEGERHYQNLLSTKLV